MKRAFRIGYNRYYRDDIFEKHLEFIKKNIKTVDEIAMFVEFSHYGYWPIEYTLEHAKIISDRVKRYKEAGVKSVGINILCTVGHLEEGWDVFPHADLQYMENENGEQSKACLCFSGDDFLDYISKRYSVYAKTGTDFIWIDDDIRPGNHGVVRNHCFCPNCIKKFNEINKTNYNRNELVKALENNIDLKEKWNSFHENAVLKVFETIKEAVNKANPNVKLGYMSGYDNVIPSWMQGCGAVMGRPGGGFYNDKYPLQVFEKYYNVQYQLEKYPNTITDIQYEYEAFNFQTFEKSVRFSELETSLALMAGCNGVLYNNNTFSDMQNFYDMVCASSKKWNVLTKINKNLKPCGVYLTNTIYARTLNELSIPFTVYKDNSVSASVIGEQWQKLTDAEIEQILNKNVLTDGRGLEILSERGFEKYCGGKVKNAYDNGMSERFSNHELNGEYKDFYRDVIMNFVGFNKEKAYELEPSEKAEIVSNLETITHKDVGCASYVFQSDKNTRFAADGHLYPNSAKTAAKKEQILNIIDWLSDNKLPVVIKKSAKIMPAVMSNSEGDMSIMLTNASFDETGSFECVIRNNKKFYIIANNGELIKAKQIQKDDETVVTIDNINGWDYILLTNKKI